MDQEGPSNAKDNTTIMTTLTPTFSPPNTERAIRKDYVKDDLGDFGISRWARRRRHRAVYRAARARGDSVSRANHLANVAVDRNLAVATALDGRTAWT
jgi:hypothetical protein